MIRVWLGVLLVASSLSAQIEDPEETIDLDAKNENQSPADEPAVERVAYMPKGFDMDKLVDTDLVSFGFGVDSYNEEIPELSISEVAIVLLYAFGMFGIGKIKPCVVRCVLVGVCCCKSCFFLLCVLL